MDFPKTVKIVEVSPRDGLQNEPKSIPTSIKLKFIEALSQSGLTIIETTSFVSPKWVPQMADHTEIMQQIKRDAAIRYPVLVPNQKGLEKAIEAECKDIAVFTAASETFSQKNTNCSIEESLSRIKTITEQAKKANIVVRGYVSCALGCPYEGKISTTKVSEIATSLYELGCEEISLGDTIGVGTPRKTQSLIETVAKKIPKSQIAVHFHDTYGQALANIYAALELGIATIDTSAAGLGGCPYAPGAGGNVATEDILYLLNGMGIKTGVDVFKIMEASQIILDYLEIKTRSKAAQALQSQQKRASSSSTLS